MSELEDGDNFEGGPVDPIRKRAMMFAYEWDRRFGGKGTDEQLEDLFIKYASDAPAPGTGKATVLPDGSGFFTASLPLPAGHWSTEDGQNEPPMPFRIGTAMAQRRTWEDGIRKAARYAVRASTINGKEADFDPDAMVQNMIVGMIGYFTPDGTSSL